MAYWAISDLNGPELDQFMGLVREELRSPPKG
jgi:hypothetical protein